MQNYKNIEKSFILGNNRSGTSLLRIMLNSNPVIIAPPECGFLQWWSTKYGNWSEKDNEKRLGEFVKDLLSSKKFETWGIDEDGITDFIMKENPGDYGDLMRLIYIYWAGEKGSKAKVVSDKNNYYLNHLEELLKVWNDAKFVFMVRDGRDVACSYIALEKLNSDSPYAPNLPVKIDEIASEWNENNKKILCFLEKHKKTNESVSIKYEDLVLRPKRELERICDFFQIDFSSNMLEYYLYNDEPDSTIDWKKKTKKPLDVSSIGKYKEKLSKEQIQIFSEIAREMLQEFNYEL
jgi:hypothetical protein